MPTIQGNYLVFDATTGTPLAALDAKELTVRRTACASALAADYLARDDAKHLVMVGSGALAPHLIGAHASVRPIEKITIWNRHAEKAHELAKSIAEQGMAAEGTEDLEAAVSAADIVSCATMSRAPLVRGDWLKPGVHVDLVGAFAPDMRETDDEAMARARVFVDTRDGALKEGGDIVQAIAAGAIKEADIQSDLFQLCRNETTGRGSDEEITLFKSVGAALEDLAAAILVIEKT
jgi:ornithine cyclodeaminase